MATPEEIRRAREATAYGGLFNNFFATNRAYRNRLAQQGRRPVLGGLLSKEPVMGTDTLRYEGIRPFVGNLLEPFIKGGDTIRASRAGLIPQEDMLGEAFGAAGAAMLGGGFAPKPAGSLGANALFTRKPNNIMDEFRPETYYHGTRSDIEYFDPNMVDLGVHVGTKGQANERIQDLVKRDDPVYTSPFDSFKNISGQKPESSFRTGEGPMEGAQVLPLKVRADYPLRMPDVGEWDRSEVVMYYIEKMLGEDGDPRLREAFEDFDFDELDNIRDQFYDKDEWKASIENREFLDDIRDRIKDAGYDSIVYKNAVESSRDEGIQDSMIILDPSNLRSVNAEFDPAYSNYPDLLAANRSRAAGVLATIGDNGGPPLDKPLTKEQLDPLGYQKTKMRRPFSEVEVQQSDLGENLARKPMSWENMEGNVILPFYGDRTSRGLLVEGVNDYKFDAPVYTEGGVDFKVGPAAQKDRAIWASNQNIITRLSKEADKAQRDFGGRDILGVTGSMAPDANDFATFTGEAAAELVKGSKITKKTAKEFDATMKALDPTFVGLLSPDLRDWVKNTSSPNRKSFIRLMDSRPMQDAGLPSPAEIRKSVTDPTQYELPAGMFGLGVSRIDTGAPLRFNNPKGDKPAANVPHSTYNTQITGDYLGSLPPVPQRLIFKDVYDAISGKLDKRGNPLTEANMTHAIKTKMPAQELTPQIIDGILNYLARQER